MYWPKGGRHTPFSKDISHNSFSKPLMLLKRPVARRCEMVMPGDDVTMTVGNCTIAMEKATFAIREGGRTVGAGVVGNIIE